MTVVVPGHMRDRLHAFARQLCLLEKTAPAAALPVAAARPDIAAKDGHPQRWAQLTGLRLRPGNMKLGELLARNIAHEIVQGGWTLGMSLGTEEFLLERYGISRGVLREAIRILEFHGIARMRLGTGGGLVITMPNMDTTIFGISLFLESRGIDLSGLTRVRRALEVLAFERMIALGDSAHGAALHDAVMHEQALGPNARASDLQSFHKHIARLSGDPIIELFMDTTLRLFRFHADFARRRASHPEFVTRILTCHAGICDALQDQDVALARDLLQHYLEGLEVWSI